MLYSPTFTLAGDATVCVSMETYVYYDFQQPLVSGELNLRDGRGQGQFHQPFQPAPDRNYHS